MIINDPSILVGSQFPKIVFAAWAHALSCALDLCEKDTTNPVEVNPGIKDAVNNSVRPIFQGMDELAVAMLAKRAVIVGDAVLRRADAPNEVTRALAVAYAITKLIDQSPPAIDPDSTLAAAALGMVMESDDTDDEVWCNAQQPKIVARRMLEIFGSEIVKTIIN